MQKQTHHLLLIWMMLASVVLFGLYIAWHEEVLLMLYLGDKSRLSWAISLLFVLISLYCARRVLLVSQELNRSNTVYEMITRHSGTRLYTKEGTIYLADEIRLPDCMLTVFLLDLAYDRADRSVETESTSSDLLEVYEARLKNPHNIGWFFSDIMIKLGLLGTIIGFVLMLGSVINVTDFDVSTMQNILRQMSAGMGTALYTTFAGLVCSIITATQFHLLDQGADELVDQAKHLTHAHFLPRFGQIA
ncbi:MAG: MotA/TolQ/ExbB proton channel family protein [Gammaproteobacteria bacterium]